MSFSIIKKSLIKITVHVNPNDVNRDNDNKKKNEFQ